MRILNVVGARPNFVKIAPLMKEQRKRGIDCVLVHTGQHYDDAMSRSFFRDLEIPEPNQNLKVKSIPDIMLRFDTTLKAYCPDIVLVVGDVDSTLACALVARRQNITIAHVEAGLRCGDMTMPEEVNRKLVDQISDWLFTTEYSGEQNLLTEGIDTKKIHFVGNVMIDTLKAFKPRADQSDILDRLHLTGGQYAVLTLHRPSNVDDVDTFADIIDGVKPIARDMPVIFPVHPRVNIDSLVNIRPVDPMGYLDFIRLIGNAHVVLTDSGGVQEETTYLGIPCITLRENTERPVTVSVGTNMIAGTSAPQILGCYSVADQTTGSIPDLWDGHAAERIIDVLEKKNG